MVTAFLGTSQFAAAILERLAGGAHAPALVVTRPDRPRGRGRRSASPPVAEAARRLGIALQQPPGVNTPQARARMAQAAPQMIVVCAFGALIKEPLLSDYELLNVHPSLLPRWRGAAPIERSIMAGDERTGVSIMRLTAGLDSGPVCLAEAEPIGPEDSYGSLTPRLEQIAGDLLLRALEETEHGEPLAFVEQDEHGATYAEKIGAADRLLDPAHPACELERVVRALHPHIGARVALPDGTLLGVHHAACAGQQPNVAALRRSDSPAGEQGEGRAKAPRSGQHLGVRALDGRLVLVCNPGVLELLSVQPPGGRVMDGASYLRGHGAPGRR